MPDDFPLSSSRTCHGPWARIDRQAMTHNLGWLRQRLRRQNPAVMPRLWAVVKADAYGHGLAHAQAALQDADGLCVASLNDVLHLRRTGWTRPILLLSMWGIASHDLLDPALGELHVVIDDPAQLPLLEHRHSGSRPLHAWLRHAGQLRSLGVEQPDYGRAFTRLRELVQSGKIAGAGHLHHYAAAEDPQALPQERQAFESEVGFLPGPRCTGNSAALCGDLPETLHPDGHWLRSGLLLYGGSALPGRHGADLGLRPAMSLHAPLLSVRRIKAGQAIGYGDSFRARQDTCIGTVGIGYGHGLPRNFWQHGRLLAGQAGRRVPLAGRVAMDCLTVDLGPDAREQAGDVMTVWGMAPSGQALPVEQAAESCGTIAAELLTSLTARVPLLKKSHSAGD